MPFVGDIILIVQENAQHFSGIAKLGKGLIHLKVGQKEEKLYLRNMELITKVM